MFSKKLFIAGCLATVGLAVVAVEDVRFIAPVILAGVVLIIDRLVHIQHVLMRIADPDSNSSAAKRQIALQKSFDKQTQLVKRRFGRLERKIKEADFRLYKQIESRDILRSKLTEQQFDALGGLRSWAIAPDTALLIYELVGPAKSLNIVEAGSGASTLVFASALVNKSIKGHVYSMEHEPEYAEKTRQKVADGGVDRLATVIDAPIEKQQIGRKKLLWFSQDAVKKLPDSIDLLFVDSPPGGLQAESRYPALPLLYDKLTDNALVIVDDYNRADEQTIVDSWLGKYTDFNLEVVKSDHGTAILRKTA